MASNLCWDCANAEGHLINMDPSAVLASTYQLDKFMKHTQPTWTVGVNSVFADPTTAAYAGYVVTSLVSGSVALDRFARPTFIWYAGKTIGATYTNGIYSFPNDAVKVVLPHDQKKVHAYSVSSTGYTAVGCARCAKPILG